jgi:hypothetical protein
VGTLKHPFIHYITIKMVLCYLVATSTGSKSQLFQRWREWE